MVRKLIWLFVGYVVLQTIAPNLAAVMVGILIASLVTAIKLPERVWLMLSHRSAVRMSRMRRLP